MGTTTEAPMVKPETKTMPSLNDFFQRQRASVAPAKPIDQPKIEDNGQSEAAKETEKPAEQAKATEPEKTDKKEKTAEELKKELSDQAKANLRLGKEKADLQRQFDEMTKKMKEVESKLDGTYKEPTAEQKASEETLRAEFAKWEQRRDTSRDEAIKEYGEETVLSNIYREDSPYTKLSKEKPWLVQRVMQAEKPVHEALAAVNEEAILAKFGRTEADVLKTAKGLLRSELFEEFKQELQRQDGGDAKPAVTVPSLNRARSAGSDPKTGGGDTVRTFRAGALFPHNNV